ncbi:hypothetical protein Syun_004322 [Stephania yunnanensis]|uniref:Uncharacterized protein n=1 Tax=Stephania yunnanensis TaxID=152371 RepID=A0AAP0Q1B8_9MAGN
MESSNRGVPYGAAPYRSREGLSTRIVGNSDEIQLRIDPMHGELDDHITANDSDQSSSRREEQREAVEQKHCPAGFKPRLACDPVCTLLFLHGLPVVQVFQKIAGWITPAGFLKCSKENRLEKLI